MRLEQPEDYARLREKTRLEQEETDTWRKIAREMVIPYGENGLIEQHDGFFDLPHTEIDRIPASEFPLYEHWSYDRIYRTDMIKQPDVLMILYLYNSCFSRETKRVNYEFYEPRTVHESSLSPAIHSILAAELDKTDAAVRFFGYATRLRFAPRLPARWKRLEFSVVNRGRILRIRMERNGTAFRVTEGKPLQLCVYDKEYHIGPEELIIPCSE